VEIERRDQTSARGSLAVRAYAHWAQRAHGCKRADMRMGDMCARGIAGTVSTVSARG
jgi:hypothetical protein